MDIMADAQQDRVGSHPYKRKLSPSRQAVLAAPPLQQPRTFQTGSPEWEKSRSNTNGVTSLGQVLSPLFSPPRGSWESRVNAYNSQRSYTRPDVGQADQVTPDTPLMTEECAPPRQAQSARTLKAPSFTVPDYQPPPAASPDPPSKTYSSRVLAEISGKEQPCTTSSDLMDDRKFKCCSPSRDWDPNESKSNVWTAQWASLVAAAKQAVSCSAPEDDDDDELAPLEIGLPTNVKHLVHVSFDRFKGFLGLPDDLGDAGALRKAPSCSASVFGVNPESLQCSYDASGKHCVPTILIQLQERLYAQNGTKVEGIFRITAENAKEEWTREQLNNGIVPDNVDVHILAGLIKAWFRELPSGVLDSLTPEQVADVEKEEQAQALLETLPPTQLALMDWALDLMTDVAENEAVNKMNPRNIAMVFAPNMTQVMDPLKALMHAVQVLHFLRMLVEKRRREREEQGLMKTDGELSS